MVYLTLTTGGKIHNGWPYRLLDAYCVCVHSRKQSPKSCQMYVIGGDFCPLFAFNKPMIESNLTLE